MCLSSLETFKVNKKYGYKWFASRQGNFYYSPLEHRTVYPYGVNKWYQAKSRSIFTNLTSSHAEYLSGFHIFYLKKDALKSYFSDPRYENVLCKVEFEDYITGYGDGSTVGSNIKQIVAQKMKIVKRISK